MYRWEPHVFLLMFLPSVIVISLIGRDITRRNLSPLTYADEINIMAGVA